jgi:hypothetical protein
MYDLMTMLSLMPSHLLSDSADYAIPSYLVHDFYNVPLPVPANQAWRYELCFRGLAWGKTNAVFLWYANTLAGITLYRLEYIYDLLDRPVTLSTGIYTKHYLGRYLT